MMKVILWSLGIAAAVALSGGLKTATLDMARMAAEAQKSQPSYSKFNERLWKK